MDYSPVLRDALVSPLAREGMEGVKASVDVMTAYDLLREDWDSIVELCMWTGSKDPRTSIEGKVSLGTIIKTFILLTLRRLKKCRYNSNVRVGHLE